LLLCAGTPVRFFGAVVRSAPWPRMWCFAACGDAFVYAVHTGSAFVRPVLAAVDGLAPSHRRATAHAIKQTLTIHMNKPKVRSVSKVTVDPLSAWWSL
jgi:hypothetical protein